jgi:hypothetical protein
MPTAEELRFNIVVGGDVSEAQAEIDKLVATLDDLEAPELDTAFDELTRVMEALEGQAANVRASMVDIGGQETFERVRRETEQWTRQLEETQEELATLTRQRRLGAHGKTELEAEIATAREALERLNETPDLEIGLEALSQLDQIEEKAQMVRSALERIGEIQAGAEFADQMQEAADRGREFGVIVGDILVGKYNALGAEIEQTIQFIRDMDNALAVSGESWDSVSASLSKANEEHREAEKLFEDALAKRSAALATIGAKESGRAVSDDAYEKAKRDLEEIIPLVEKYREEVLALEDSLQDLSRAEEGPKLLEGLKRLQNQRAALGERLGIDGGPGGPDEPINKVDKSLRNTTRSAAELNRKMTLLSRILYLLRRPQYLTTMEGMRYSMQLLAQASVKAGGSIMALVKGPMGAFLIAGAAIIASVVAIFSSVKLLSGELAQLAVQMAKVNAQANAMGTDPDLTPPWEALAEQIDASDVAMTSLRLNTIKSLTAMGASMDEAVAKADQLAGLAGQVITIGGPSVRPEEALRAVEQLTAGNARAFSGLTGIDLGPLQRELQRTQPFLTDLERGAILTEAAMQRLAGVNMKDPVTDLGDAKKVMDDLKEVIGEEMKGSLEALATQLVNIANIVADWKPVIVAISKAFTWMLDVGLRAVEILMAAINDAIGLGARLVGMVVTAANWIPGVDLDDVKDAIDGFSDMQRAIADLEGEIALGKSPIQGLAEGVAFLAKSGALATGNLYRLQQIAGVSDRKLHALLLTIREQAQAWGLDEEALSAVELEARKLERTFEDLDNMDVDIGGDAYEKALGQANDLIKKHGDLKDDISGGFGLVGAWRSAADALDEYNKDATAANALALAQTTSAATMMSIEEGPEALVEAYSQAIALAEELQYPESYIDDLKAGFDWATDLTNDAIRGNEELRAAFKLTDEAGEAANASQQAGFVTTGEQIADTHLNKLKPYHQELLDMDGLVSTQTVVLNFEQGAVPSLNIQAPGELTSSQQAVRDEALATLAAEDAALAQLQGLAQGMPSEWFEPTAEHRTGGNALRGERNALRAAEEAANAQYDYWRQKALEFESEGEALSELDEKRIRQGSLVPPLLGGVDGNINDSPFPRSGGGGGGQQATEEEIRKLIQAVNEAIRIGISGGVSQGFSGNVISQGFGADEFLTTDEGGNLQIQTLIIKGVWDFADPAAKRKIIKELELALSGLKAEV